MSLRHFNPYTNQEIQLMCIAIFILIGVLAVFVIVSGVMLIAMKLHQAASTRSMVERRLLELKFELRRLRQDMTNSGTVTKP
jgi:hypothetical protein